MKKIEEDWDFYGKNDPYFAVVTLDKFKNDNLTETVKEDFFQTGEEHIEKIWAEIETNFAPGFKPRRVLDFGCGVGRLVVPLARRGGAQVTGVDISRQMLDEARRNCQERDLTNTEFLQTDEFLGREHEKFDLIHSFIVFQHIRPEMGEQIIRKMIDSLAEGGIGALHLTYFNPSKKIQAFRFKMYRDLPFIYQIRNLLKGGPGEPLIPMYVYDLNRIFALLQENSCHRVYARFSFHGFNGVLIFFQKQKTDLF